MTVGRLHSWRGHPQGIGVRDGLLRPRAPIHTVGASGRSDRAKRRATAPSPRPMCTSPSRCSRSCSPGCISAPAWQGSCLTPSPPPCPTRPTLSYMFAATLSQPSFQQFGFTRVLEGYWWVDFVREICLFNQSAEAAIPWHPVRRERPRVPAGLQGSGRDPLPEGPVVTVTARVSRCGICGCPTRR